MIFVFLFVFPDSDDVTETQTQTPPAASVDISPTLCCTRILHPGFRVLPDCDALSIPQPPYLSLSLSSLLNLLFNGARISIDSADLALLHHP